MFTFMAGATSLGQVAAKKVVVSMSSARPQAALAMKLAVAGATAKRSAPSVREMCFTSQEKTRSKVST